MLYLNFFGSEGKVCQILYLRETETLAQVLFLSGEQLWKLGFLVFLVEMD